MYILIALYNALFRDDSVNEDIYTYSHDEPIDGRVHFSWANFLIFLFELVLVVYADIFLPELFRWIMTYFVLDLGFALTHAIYKEVLCHYVSFYDSSLLGQTRVVKLPTIDGCLALALPCALASLYIIALIVMHWK